MNIDFKKCGGLVPAIVQDAITKNVLMLGYMNEEAYDKTIATKKVTFWSRSRNCLWTKGETSGNFLHLVDIKVDCDNDTLLVKAHPDVSFAIRRIVTRVGRHLAFQGRHQPHCPESGRRGTRGCHRSHQWFQGKTDLRSFRPDISPNCPDDKQRPSHRRHRPGATEAPRPGLGQEASRGKGQG